MQAVATEERTATAPRPAIGRWRRFLVAGLALGLLLPLFYEVYYVTLGINLHTVVTGQVYRSAQLSPARLRDAVSKYHIKTVINLRGCCPETDWYQDQCAVLRELGVTHFDITFSSYIWPGVPEFGQLIEVLRTCEYPILLHCRRGADRTGMASAAALLLRTEAEIPVARRQLSWRYGHISFSRTNVQDRVFDLYESWLAKENRSHTPEVFHRWSIEDYRPGQCWAEIQPLDVPRRLSLNRPTGATFRVRNTSVLPWHFRPSANSGNHLHFTLLHEDGLGCATGSAGYFDEVVPPGGSIDLTLVLPAVKTPGRYQLVVDMGDEQCCWFSLVGSFPFSMELEAGDVRSN